MLTVVLAWAEAKTSRALKGAVSASEFKMEVISVMISNHGTRVDWIQLAGVSS